MKLKRLVIFLVAAALALSGVVPAMLFQTQAAPADTVYVRKHVSLVYDNSGSMSQDLDNAENLKWAYASYAAQIFAGLLNDTDSLTMTLMNDNNGTKTLEVDLDGDRQSQVDQIHDLTNYSNGGTPYESVIDAEKVLVEKGLLSDAQIGDNAINQDEQFWLVLTTDGRFGNDGEVPKEETERRLEELLKKYSNLHLVYFGIGTEGDTSAQSGIDLRDSARLKAYPNFTAVFAEKQEQIVSTMQTLANRISGRYSVTDGVHFNGKEVTLQISGETSPVRNVAILAQKTNAKLLSAVDDDGRQLTVSRPANEQYPQNSNHDNIPEDTAGAHTALITDPGGKFVPGTVTLTFSEPVDPDEFSLMYEPAVYVNLKVEQKNAAGSWTVIPYGDKVLSGQPIRVTYEICEDGTTTPIDTAKLPGVTTEHITCGDKEISKGSEFSAPSANANITATVSLMDGTYVVSTMRTLQIISLEDYTFQVSDPLTFYPNELESNTSQYIDFKIFFDGAPATAEQISVFSIDAGSLQGTVTTPDGGVFRFTPQHAGCAPGEMNVQLSFQGHSVSSQKVTVKELVISYEAKASEDLTLFSNEVAANTKPIIFSVTRTQGAVTEPLSEKDAELFRIEAAAADGTTLNGVAQFEGGQMHFIPNDADAPVGGYTVTLYHQDAALATANISILKYNAQFTAEVFQVGDDPVELFDIKNNQSALAFVIYADGEPCTGVQLQGMLGSTLLLQHDAPNGIVKLDVSIGTYEGKPALIARPTSPAKNLISELFRDFGVVWCISDVMNVKLTVQTEKGTQASGSLELYRDPDVLRTWIIVLIVAGVILLLLFLVVLAYIARPKIIPGTITHYSGTVGNNGKITITNDTPEKIGSFLRPTIFWKPESHSIHSLIFTAEEGLYFTRNTPTCRMPAELANYYSYQDLEYYTSQVIARIDEYSGQEFNFAEIADMVNGVSVAQEVPDGTAYCSRRMSDGSFICYRDCELIELWVYYSGRAQEEDS